MKITDVTVVTVGLGLLGMADIAAYTVSFEEVYAFLACSCLLLLGYMTVKE
jgi:hypothetical protein